MSRLLSALLYALLLASSHATGARKRPKATDDGSDSEDSHDSDLATPQNVDFSHVLHHYSITLTPHTTYMGNAISSATRCNWCIAVQDLFAGIWPFEWDSSSPEKNTGDRNEGFIET